MSDREFENYLTLLSGLLRLDGKQRRAIAEELRSHMEDRLEELVSRGLSRDEAIKQALAEFGDAAGLAGQFVAISWNRKRRWLMRLTTFSVAATLLLAASLVIFWPGRNAAPGTAAVVAQARADADPFAPDAPAIAPGTPALPANEPSLQEKLNKRIDFNVVEMPLMDVFSHLQEETEIQFVLRLKQLNEASVPHDTPVTKSLRHVRVSTLLDLLLSDLELTYVEKDDLLLITTPEDAEATMEIRVYDCRDLLAMEAPPGADKFISPPPSRTGGMFAVEDQVSRSPNASTDARSPDTNGANTGGLGASGRRGDATRLVSEHDLRANRLLQIIQANVDQDSWRDFGGPGSTSEYNGLIVVTQTAQTHKKVERLFDMLREAAGLEVSKTGKVVR